MGDRLRLLVRFVTLQDVPSSMAHPCPYLIRCSLFKHRPCEGTSAMRGDGGLPFAGRLACRYIAPTGGSFRFTYSERLRGRGLDVLAETTSRLPDELPECLAGTWLRDLFHELGGCFPETRLPGSSPGSLESAFILCVMPHHLSRAFL